MNIKFLQIFLLILGLNFIGCKKDKHQSNSDIPLVDTIATTTLSNGDNEEGVLPEDLESNKDVAQYSIQVNNKASFKILDSDGNSLKYDDESNYSELPNLMQTIFAGTLFYRLQDYYETTTLKKAEIKDSQNYLKGYTQEYIEFFNSKVNLLNDLPLKTEDEKLNEVFNKIYYDFGDSEIYEGDKGYGHQTFLLVKDGRTVGGTTFRRNEEDKNLKFD